MKSKNKIPDGYKLVPPDGNYAWIVVFACCIAGITVTASMNIFSVLLYDLIIIYETNTATVSWIPSIILATAQFIGPINTVIINTFGVRKTAITGSLLISLGITTSYFCDRIELLYVTYGITVGLGFGLCTISLPIVLSQYFQKYYGVAIGLLTASFAVGRFTNTLLAQFLLKEYGCRSVFLIFGAFTLHVGVAAALFQPVRRHLILVPIDADNKKLLNEENVDKDKSNYSEEVYMKDGNRNEKNGKNIEVQIVTWVNDEESVTLQNQRNLLATRSCSLNDFGSVTSVYDENSINDKKDQLQSQTSNCSCLSRLYEKIGSKIDLSLLREPCFYIICANGILTLSITVYSGIFLFPLGVEKGYSSSQLAMLITMKAIADVVSRVLGPSLVAYFNLSVRKCYIYLGFVNGIIFAAIVFLDGYYQIIAWGLISGLTFGTLFSLSKVLLVKTMGAKRLSSVIGLSNFVQGFFILPMAPILGWIRDKTGSFAEIYLVLAVMQFIMVTLWIIKPYLPQNAPQNYS